MAAAARGKGECKVECHALQVANIFTQFGHPPDSLEKISKEMGPQSYAEFVENDRVFSCEKPATKVVPHSAGEQGDAVGCVGCGRTT